MGCSVCPEVLKLSDVEYPSRNIRACSHIGVYVRTALVALPLFRAMDTNQSRALVYMRVRATTEAPSFSMIIKNK